MAKDDSGGGKDNAGKPAEVISAFAGAATKFTQEPGDPAISKAFLLGWRIGVALDWAQTGAHRMWPDDDPGLKEDARWTVLEGQIETAAEELTSAAGESIPLGTLGDMPSSPESPAVAAYREVLVQRLYVADQFRGLAFNLGCDLEGACAGTRRLTPPGRAERPVSELKADIPALQKSLLGLATKLPPNAGHGVMNSLALWQEQLARLGDDEFDRELLRKQGGVWRSMLSGEVAAKDLLHLSDYVGTAEQVVARLQEFTRRTLSGHLLVPAIGVLVLALIGFALLFFSDTAAAGAGALLTAFGLTWKGIGQYIGKAAARGEQSLWDGQLDWTIAYRATMSLTVPTAPKRRLRRYPKDMPQDQRRSAEHFDTWQRWKERWPVFELEA